MERRWTFDTIRQVADLDAIRTHLGAGRHPRNQRGACGTISDSAERAHPGYGSLSVGGRTRHFFEDCAGFLQQGCVGGAGVTGHDRANILIHRVSPAT
jgi:hypothetical protein